jgi:2-oxoglutarate dehydrogenase E1 component
MLSRQLRSLPLRQWAQQGSRSPLALRRHLATPAAPPSPNDPFANGTNAYYAEEMYRHWRQDPNSVHVSWNVYFSGLDKGLPSSRAFSPPPNLLPPPADGAPALHANGGAELDIHLKVSLHSCFHVAPFHKHGIRRNSLSALTKFADTMSPNSILWAFSTQI